jgi:hypothetical protein
VPRGADPHLLDLAVHVKHMHLVASCEGMTLWLKAAQQIEEKIFLIDEEVKKCELLLIFSREKFEFALRSITGRVTHLCVCGCRRRRRWWWWWWWW